MKTLRLNSTCSKFSKNVLEYRKGLKLFRASNSTSYYILFTEYVFIRPYFWKIIKAARIIWKFYFFFNFYYKHEILKVYWVKKILSLMTTEWALRSCEVNLGHKIQMLYVFKIGQLSKSFITKLKLNLIFIIYDSELGDDFIWQKSPSRSMQYLKINDVTLRLFCLDLTKDCI